MSDAERIQQAVSFYDRLQLLSLEAGRLVRDMETHQHCLLPGTVVQIGSTTSLNNVLSGLQSRCIHVSNIIARAHRAGLVEMNRRAGPHPAMPSDVVDIQVDVPPPHTCVPGEGSTVCTICGA